MEIKVMSIREPHASLFLHGLKHYETREKKTNYRGCIYIQSSKNIGDDIALNNELIDELGYKPETCGNVIFKAILIFLSSLCTYLPLDRSRILIKHPLVQTV